MKRYLAFLFTLLFLLNFSSSATAGKIVLANDEWTLSNAGFSTPNDPGTFVTNIISWFTDGSTGDFLAYSDNFGLTESLLAAAMTTADNSWEVSTLVPFTLANLQNYDGVFLGGHSADTGVLIDYVNAGGNVYLMGGTGGLGYNGNYAQTEADAWNPFLNTFGLGFEVVYNTLNVSSEINSTHPIFSGVDHLLNLAGNDTLDISISDELAQVLVTDVNGHGLYAVYESAPEPEPEPVLPIPEPATMLLLGAGLIGLAGARRKIK